MTEVAHRPAATSGLVAPAVAAIHRGGGLALSAHSRYWLAADAANEKAVATLRCHGLTGLDEPLTVLVGSLEEAQILAVVDNRAAARLGRRDQPVVLDRRAGIVRRVQLADSIGAYGCRRAVRLVIPAAPRLVRLLAGVARPLAVTGCRSYDACLDVTEMVIPLD